MKFILIREVSQLTEKTKICLQCILIHIFIISFP